MIDRLAPLSFSHLMRWILKEQKKTGSIFGIRDFCQTNPFKTLQLFGEKLETPFGPAAGPHTQYAQSIIAAYVTGCRYFELRTVSVRSKEELNQNPVIKAESEGINVEGAPNLTIEEAYEEYVKAWIAIKVLSREYEMGGMDGFIFNMCVGYDYAHVSSDVMSTYLDNMRDASNTPIFKECISFLKDNIDMFQNFTLEDIDDISTRISNSVTVVTPHDIKASELERIAKYLLTERKLNTYIKLGVTLLGYDYCRSTLDSMGYFDIDFCDKIFEMDMKYSEACILIEKLMHVGRKEDLLFGVKLTSTLPVKHSDDMNKTLKLSGKALFPLSVALAAKLSADFDEHLRIAFSGGVDANNVEDIYEAGIWPITMNTTILKPGGYNRFKQFSYTFQDWSYDDFYCTKTGLLKRIAEKVKQNNHYTRPVRKDEVVKRKEGIPLINCFISPCKEGCPLDQDINAYLNLIDEEKYAQALRVIIEKNPMPFTTGTICTHDCMTNCVRNYYEKPVKIREAKLIAAQNGYEEVLEELHPEQPAGRRLNIAVVGGGPAGISSAFFLAREGHKVTIFCKMPSLGGIVKYLIPDFKMPIDRVDKDIALLKRLNVEIHTETEIRSISELTGYDKVILTMGATKYYPLELPGQASIPAIDFLADYKKTKGKMELGKDIVVIGGGSIAIDAARAAKRIRGVENVYVLYRRSRRYMPANDEELAYALNEGIELLELMNPYEYSEGYVKCHVTALGDYGYDGRKEPYDTDEIASVHADCVITAVGEHVDSEFYRNNGINVDDIGKPIVNQETMESNIPNVYIAGAGRRGPCTLVEAIADARNVSKAILSEFDEFVVYKRKESYIGERRSGGRRSGDNKLSGLYSKKGILREPHYRNDSGRCLDCSRLCENCVDVCPNRANVEIKVPNNPVPQIVHVERLCNECGNCKTFCSYDDAPYKKKFTLYSSLDDFYAGDNEGIVFTLDGSAFTIRLKGRVFNVSRIEAAQFNGISTDLCNLIATLYQDYRYLIIG